MVLVFNTDVFALGIAVGVLGLVLLFSLLISYAYDEPTLLFLAAYLSVMVAGLVAGERWQVGAAVVHSLLLVAGPAFLSLLLIWLLRKRSSDKMGKASVAALCLADVGLLGFILAGGLGFIKPGTMLDLTTILRLLWGAMLTANLVYRTVQTIETVSAWKWWLILGHAAGLAVALLFMTGVAQAGQGYWPVVLMLLVQVPPIYLSLVWRSRLRNEIMLRSTAAGVVDPLTGLATTPVLVERLMRIVARSQQVKIAQTSDALFLIEVQNWHGLIAELGADFNEKLLLESALRLRRSVGDNDIVARISGGRFAVVAQGLANQEDIATLATRLVVSGLRIDSPLLPGVELKFRIMVLNLKLSAPLSLPVTQAWLDQLASRFQAWPSSHRSRSILTIQENDDLA